MSDSSCDVEEDCTTIVVDRSFWRDQCRVKVWLREFSNMLRAVA